jgi:hypothetical protein
VTTIESEAFYYCTSLISITIPDTINNIDNNVFGYHNEWSHTLCPIQLIAINCCNTTNNNVLETLNKIDNGYPEETKNEFREYINTLKVALSSDIAAKPTEDLIDYVTDILALQTSDNTIISVIKGKSGTFNLDLSNTGLTQSDIGDTNTLGWNITFG